MVFRTIREEGFSVCKSLKNEFYEAISFIDPAGDLAVERGTCFFAANFGSCTVQPGEGQFGCGRKFYDQQRKY